MDFLPKNLIYGQHSETDNELFNKHQNSNEYGERIIYVDDDNTEGPWDGTKEHPYQHIEDGIDVANDKDTVFVFSGVYREGWIPIEKSIRIIGEDRESTIVDMEGHGVGFRILANSVKIQRLTITQSTTYNSSPLGASAGIKIYSGRTGNVISENYIKNTNYHGIDIDGASFNFIFNNIITEQSRGINIYFGAMFNIVYRNQISNNKLGVNHDRSHFNLITRNNFIDNDCNAYFKCTVPLLVARWHRNYWDDHIGEPPKRIDGELIYYPPYPWSEPTIYKWTDFDLRPAQEPYDI